MQEFYKILNVSEDATDEEIESAYNKLKEKYSRERFYEGEIGNDAARSLTKLENAYDEIKSYRSMYGSSAKEENHSYKDIEDLIKEGKISEAQSALDNITERDAEWHYLQSVVFYKKNWVNESKKQLEIAINMDSSNEKYADSYTKLKQKIEFNDRQFRSGNVGGDTNSGDNPNARQMGETGNECLSFCATWCCMNMLCNGCCR